MANIESLKEYYLVLVADIVYTELVPDIVDIVLIVDTVKKVQQWSQLLAVVVYMNMGAELMLHIAVVVVVFDIVVLVPVTI